jgi:hypothetical protein
VRHVVVVGVHGLDAGRAQRLDQPHPVGVQDVVAGGDDRRRRQSAQVAPRTFTSGLRASSPP